MKKSRFITIAICLLFVALSGFFYLKSSAGGTKSYGMDLAAAEEDGAVPRKEEAAAKDEAAGADSHTSGPKKVDQGASEGSVTVFICGAVKKPGVYSFDVGGRLCDAVKRAGGFKKSAAATSSNLARLLQDGEQITILTKKQYKKELKGQSGTSLAPAAEGYASGNAGGGDGRININSASKEELMQISGIGESKADAIIEYRSLSPFKAVEDIKNVSGIKDGIFNSIKDKITV